MAALWNGRFARRAPISSSSSRCPPSRSRRRLSPRRFITPATPRAPRPCSGDCRAARHQTSAAVPCWPASSPHAGRSATHLRWSRTSWRVPIRITTSHIASPPPTPDSVSRRRPSAGSAGGRQRLLCSAGTSTIRCSLRCERTPPLRPSSPRHGESQCGWRRLHPRALASLIDSWIRICSSHADSLRRPAANRGRPCRPLGIAGSRRLPPREQPQGSAASRQPRAGPRRPAARSRLPPPTEHRRR